MGCLVVVLLCSVPRMVAAFDQPETDDQDFVIDTGAAAPNHEEDGDYGENSEYDKAYEDEYEDAGEEDGSESEAY